MKDKPTVLIIGAGVGGLCAGIELASLGLSVQILESQSHPGGKIHPIHVGTHRCSRPRRRI